VLSGEGRGPSAIPGIVVSEQQCMLSTKGVSGPKKRIVFKYLRRKNQTSAMPSGRQGIRRPSQPRRSRNGASYDCSVESSQDVTNPATFQT
jgi:hypothetical protein